MWDPAVRLKTASDLYLTFELRLRYEFSRRCAAYLGYVYDRKLTGSARLARLSGEPAIDHRAVAGMDLFF